MSLYVLDTDILSLFERGHPAIEQHVGLAAPTDIVTTIISVEEQLTGWQGRLRRLRKPEAIAQVYERFTATVSFLSGLRILSFTEDAIRRYLDIASLKLNIGKMDSRIAAIALENSGTVVSRNRRDFERVPNLTVFDWTVPP